MFSTHMHVEMLHISMYECTNVQIRAATGVLNSGWELLQRFLAPSMAPIVYSGAPPKSLNFEKWLVSWEER